MNYFVLSVVRVPSTGHLQKLQLSIYAAVMQEFKSKQFTLCCVPSLKIVVASGQEQEKTQVRKPATK